MSGPEPPAPGGATQDSLGALEFVDRETGLRVGDGAVYDALVGVCDIETVVRTGERRWHRRPRGAIWRATKGYGLAGGGVCSGLDEILLHGSCGIVFLFAGWCVKVTATGWERPALLAGCSSVVPVSLRHDGRVQIMPTATCDAFSLHDHMARAAIACGREAAVPVEYTAQVMVYRRLTLFVIEAAQELADRGLVHIDLKPENILVFRPPRNVREAFRLCDVEGVVSLRDPPASPAPRSMTFLASRSFCADRTMDVFSMLFAACCTGLDMANSLVPRRLRVDMNTAIASPSQKTRSFDLGHPLVRAVQSKQTGLTECWLDMLCVMAGHAWGDNADADFFAAQKILAHGRQSAEKALAAKRIGSFAPF